MPQKFRPAGAWRPGLNRAIGLLLWTALIPLIFVTLVPSFARLEVFAESRRAWFGLTENFFPEFALAAAGLGIAFVLFRRPRGAVLSCLTVVAFGVPVLSSLHAAPAEPSDVPTLKVMTFNLWVLNGETDRFIAYLREEKPDIVFLEETTEAHKRAIATLADLYPTQVTCHTGIVPCETMLLSRFPMHAQKAGPIAGALPSTAMAELDIGGRRLTAVAVHLAWPFPMGGRDAQREQALHFARALDDIMGPLLIGGDFNGGSWIRNQRDVRGLARLTGEPGIHPSWPAIPIAGLAVPELLRLPIDHVLTRDGPVVISAAAGPELGSDHLPILATVAWPVEN
ncbi:MAG TPA: endonuclease/exonuclease/phosphatase family protein [Candidatus Binatia bacterium]|nr:endonuclease/exonuclease/phosphatase family protein [Candidatus Binatia bacterium]